MGRKIRLVTALLVVIGLAWTGIWLFIRSEVASRMDAELDKLRSRGLVIDCPDRSITGWPFRIEVACVGPSLSMPDRLVQAHAKALRVMALIYQPTTLIGELDGPVTASGANGEDIAADWRLLQASVKLAGTRPSLVSIAGDGLSGTLRKPGTPDVTFVAEHGEVHGRPAPDAAEGQVDIDLAARFAAVTLTLGGKPLGPAEGNLLIDSVARRLPARAEPGDTYLKSWAGNDGRLELRSARFETGGFAVTGKGAVTAEADGLPSGSIRLFATGFDKLLTGAGSVKSKAELAVLATAFTLYGKPATEADATGRAIGIGIEHGRVKVGVLPVLQLKPLF